MDADVGQEPGRVSAVEVTYELDAGYGARGRVGLVALTTDATCEHDLRTIFCTHPPS